MNVVDYDPSKGVARQGDVVICKLPEGYRVSREVMQFARSTEARDARLVLVEGEASGHHHSILARAFEPLRYHDAAMAHGMLKDGAAPEGKPIKASLYRDDTLLARLQSHGWLRTTHLARGFLVVEDGPAILEHQEHDAIRIPPGEYYVGRQETIDPKTGALT